MTFAARVGLCAAALTACLPRVQSSKAMGEETVIYAAKLVRTMDVSRPTADAIAVRGDRIVGVGPRASLEQANGGARVVELPDAVIVPGLADAHVHLSGLGNHLAVVNLSSAKSEAEAVAAVKAAANSRRGEWVEGRGWDQNRWPGGQFPGRALLDAAFPNTPVYLKRIDGHAAWVNGEALRRAGVTDKTPDPPGGRLLRDAHGELTGVLVDHAAGLVGVKVPPLTEEQRQARLVSALVKCAEVGLTSVHDAGMDLETFTQLQQWDASGRLPLRIYAMAEGRGADSDAYLERGPFKGRMLEMRSVKFVIDGALGSRGAALHAPYSDDPSQSGLLLWEPEELRARMHAFMERGFQVNVHAIGDRANTLTIETIAGAAAQVRDNPGRHRIEHAQVLREEDIPRIAKAGLLASMQPTHATSDMPWAQARLGPDRIKGAYAWRSVLKAGIPLALGSDFPIEAPDPLHGLYAARTRQDERGQPEGGWFPDQRLTGAEALAGFTTGAAYASFAEGSRGKLAVGFDADFTALSADPVESPPMQVRNARVLLTAVAGREIFRAKVP